MVYVVAEFSDSSVSSVPKKWETMIGKTKKMYFPKKGALAKIKANVDAVKGSKKWNLHSYRLLMNGATFATYEEARQAEIVAQSHSTMESFQKSYAKKRNERKRPRVIFDSSSERSECSDSKKIEKLSKIDEEFDVTDEKEYSYTHSTKKVSDWLASEEIDTVMSQKSVERNSQPGSENVYQQPSNNGSSIGDDNSSQKSVMASTDSNDDESVVSSKDESNSKNSSVNDETDENSSGDEAVQKLRRKSIAQYVIKDDELGNGPEHNQNCKENELPLESTNLDQQDPLVDYNGFKFERRIQFIENALSNAIKQLNENNKLLIETVDALRDIKFSIGGLTQTIKDLATEVFDNKEELKKRNGLFTDLLAPQIQFPIKKLRRYDDVEMELQDCKIVDNVIKYLGSTINESSENAYLKGCLNIVFSKKFLLEKVWWKKEERKAYFKKSQLLHCIRESYKNKFGLIEPRKTDKQVDNLVHKICTNIKDTERKAIKAEKTKQEAKDKMLNEAYEQEYQTHIAKRKLEETEQGAEVDVGTARKKKKSKRSENSSEKPVLSGLEEEHILLEKQANPAKGNSKKPKSKKKYI